MDTLRQQIAELTRTITEERNHRLTQERHSTSPITHTIYTPPSMEQHRNHNNRQTDASAIDRDITTNTDRDFMTVRPSHTTIHPPQNDEPTPFSELRRSSRPRTLDLDDFLSGTRRPTLTEEDMERFARKTLDKLTDQQITAFAEQLERYLMHDPNHHDFLAEGNALRKLMQYTKLRRLAAWLQLYANPEIQFSFPKKQFWRKKYDENAHFCVPQPHQKPDISECIEQLTRTLAVRLDSQPTPNFRF